MMKRNACWSKEEDLLLIQNVHLSIKELIVLIGRSDGAIRNRKTVLGIKANKYTQFTNEEKKIIEYWYTKEKGVDLDSLSNFLNRPKTSVSKIARDMNLTKYGNFTKLERDHRSNSLQDKVKDSNPSRFQGHIHSEESRVKISKNLIESYKNIPISVRKERAKRAVETRIKNGNFFNTSENAYSRCKGGYRDDLLKYFRSSWEANIVRILNELDIKWEYEIKRFYFYDNKSGVLSYQPDFYLPEYNIWIEVKGWMDEKSKERLKLFEEYYPEEYKNLFLINSKAYYILEKQYKDVLNIWEYKGNYLKTNKVSEDKVCNKYSEVKSK